MVDRSVTPENSKTSALAAGDGNAWAVFVRAIELHDLAEEYRNDTDLSPEIRRNANTAQMCATMAWLYSRSGKFANAAQSLSVAERAIASLRRQILIPYAERGVPMMEGSKQPRLDRLAKLMVEASFDLPPKSTAMDTLNRAEQIDRARKLQHRVIDEIDRDDPNEPAIFLRGKREALTFKTFKNRLSGYRKKIRKGIIPNPH